MAFSLQAAGSGAASGAATGAVAGPWGAAIGAVVGGVLGGIGGGQEAPKFADLPETDLNKVVSQTIEANTKAFEEGKGLSSDVNTFNQNEANRLMEIAIPGSTTLRASLVSAAQSDIDNQFNLPPEIQAQIARKAAEKGVTRGTSGGFNQFSALRDFGFNAVDFANASRVRALNTLSAVVGTAPRVSPMSPMSMFLTSQNVLAQRSRENETRQALKQGQFNADAAVANYNSSLAQEAGILAAGTLGQIGSDAIARKYGAPKAGSATDIAAVGSAGNV